MDSLFKSLADPSRRDLLDALRQTDGQTLSELEATLPLSRFGVAKHLKVLEEAGLITRVKRGRFTHHYLNAMPLADAMARWVEPFRVAPAVRGLRDLRARLEASAPQDPDFSLTTFIACDAATLWAAVTDTVRIARWQPQLTDVRRHGDAMVFDTGRSSAPVAWQIVEEVAETRLVMTLPPRPDSSTPSRVVQSITPDGPCCRFSIDHFDLGGRLSPGAALALAWARWAAAIKTWIETGTPLRMTGMGALI
ncbi:metalloregulator ArsR/SmtB family transcription factor [Jannaschia sp. 2305UL9-9]|uniref:metalloregulator ArsR/SmtB family transcription factor n=1 Tax=Jannaschia sp. 2305UL9-9 TaxID=3121638 RepID=UPI0035282AA3